MVRAGFVTSMLCAFVALQPSIAASDEWSLNSDLSCDERGAIIDRLANSTEVEISAQAVEVGSTLDFEWQRGRFPEREPVYLMVSFDQPVRIRGDNLYGLLPNATAGFSISWQQTDTRVVIPYYGRGVPASGQFSVEPLVTGPLSVRSAVVGYDGCGEQVDTPNQNSVVIQVVTSGRPQIVVNDPDDFGEPELTYVNADSSRHLQVFDGRFRLLDAATGAEIMNEVGEEPYFSPTGRYLVVSRGSTAGIYDAIDGKHITDDGGVYDAYQDWRALIWGKRDSFALHLVNGYAASTFRNLIADIEYFATGAGCRICSPLDNIVSVDLQNNVLFAEELGAIKVTSISGQSRIFESTFEYDDEEAKRRVIRESAMQAITREVGLSRTSITTDNFFSQDAKLAIRLPDIFSSSAEAPFELTRQKFDRLTMEPVLLDATETPAPEGSSSKTTNVKWRSLGAASPATEILHTRVRELGISGLSDTSVRRIDLPPSIAAIFKLNLSSNVDYEQIKKDRAGPLLEVQRKIATSSGFDLSLFGAEWQCGSEVSNGIVGEFDVVWQWVHDDFEYWLTTYECAAGSAAFNEPSTHLFSRKFPKGVLSQQMEWGPEFKLNLDNPGNNIGPSCESALDNCGFDIKVFGNLLVMYSDEARGFAIVDTDTGELVTKRFDLPRGDLFDDILLLADGEHTLSFQNDGSFFINRLEDGTTVLSGLYADDEVIVWTEDGRFDATAEGAHFVSYKFPGHVGEYTAQQFERFLKVPGLARQVLEGSYKPIEVSITPPPVLRATIGAIDDQSIAIDAEVMAFADVTRLNVFQDGLLTDTFNAESAATTANWSESVRRLPGTKWVTLVAVDENEVASAPYGVQLSKREDQRGLHVLSIGINTYDFAADDVIYDLGAAVADAELFARTLSNQSNLNNDPVVLLEQAATTERIIAELDRIVATAKAGETIALYFAGHGVQGSDGRFYLATSKTNADSIEDTAVPFDLIASKLKGAEARVAIFLDACHSGLAGQGLFSTNDDAVTNVLEAAPSGLVVFSAAKGREFALESEFVENGFFARAVADVIDAQRDQHDANKNGSIELSELFRGVKGLVVQRVQAAQVGVPSEDVLYQTPWMARHRMVGDFALF